MTRSASACGLILLVALAPASAAGPVRVVPAGTIAQPRQPRVAVSDDGNVFIVYGSGHALHLSVSGDGGTTYDPPRKIGEVQDLMLGMRRGPRVAAHGRQLVVTAIGREGDLLAWRSPDAGQTWQGPVTVNDEPTSAREGLHDTAIGPRGELVSVWLDLRSDRRMEVWGARSDDGGATWSRNQRIYRSPDGPVCPCCHPSVTFDRQGNVYVMWRNALGGNRDMYLARSTDGGRHFAPAQKLGTGSWKLDHCPMDGGALAVREPGQVTTIWRRDTDIFRTVPGRTDEQRLGRGEQPSATVTDDGAYCVWITDRPGTLRLLAPGSDRPTKLAENAADPVIAAPPSSNAPVVVVWESGRGKQTTIMAQVVNP